jgi:hypothetical protein
MKSSIYQKLYLLLLFCGFIASTIIIFYNLSPINNLALLPLTYAVSMLLVKNLYSKNKIGLALVIIEVIKACRYLVLPIMISQESLFDGVNIAPRHNESAVLLMTYELISVSLVMFFYGRKAKFVRTFKKIDNRKNTYGHNAKLVRIFKKINNRQTTFLWYIFIVLGLFIVATEPSLRERLFNFTMSFVNEFGLGVDFSAKISGTSRVFFLIGIITSFAFLANQINKFPILTKSKLFFQTIVCILLVSCLWTNEAGSVSRWNMMIGILLSIYILLFYFPRSRKKIIMGGLGGVLFVLIIGSLLKTLSFGLDDYTVSDSTQMYFSSQYFDEYFQGVRSVSNGIFVTQKYSNLNIFDGVLTDWFYSFPFLMKMVGLSNQPVASYYYHLVSNHYDLIFPTITMGLLRFGWILAPLYSCVAVFFALYFDKKLKKEQNILVKLFYVYIVFWFSLFMAISSNVIEANIWAPFIGIWLLTLEKIIFNSKTNLL